MHSPHLFAGGYRIFGNRKFVAMEPMTPSIVKAYIFPDARPFERPPKNEQNLLGLKFYLKF